MSALLVVFMVLGTGVAHHTTTFLRLTALRSDQGVWTARFGEYEISIELRHHTVPGDISDNNDTWTVKVKHTPNKLLLWEENEDENDLFDEKTQQLSDSKENFHSLDNEEYTPILKKIESLPRKNRKGKKRRQLSNKYTTTEKNHITMKETSENEGNLSELVQGSTRINVIFDNTPNDNRTEEGINKTETYEDSLWKNIAAVIFDGSSSNSGLEDSDSNQEENLEKRYDPDFGRLSEPYALPLHQSSQTDDYEEVGDPHLTSNIKSSSKTRTEMREVPEQVTDDDQGRNVLGKSSDETDDARKNEKIDNGYDYVVEDTVVSTYETSDEDDENSEEVDKKVDFSDLQLSPEMKRLAQWYPKSKPLAYDNNGYKLFPGVGWFKLVPWAERWTNASNVCLSEGAHLAVPDSTEKVQVFLRIFNNYPDVLEKSILNQQVYVGIYSSGGRFRDFHTVQGQLFEPDFAIWFPGEPDNADPGEDCVTFHRKGKIRDVPCFYNLPFLCEKAPDIS